MRPKLVLSVVGLCLLSVVAAGAVPTREAARAALFQFEQTLQGIPRGVEGDAKRTRQVREYFAKLKDTPTKLEAIGMIDSRYVHQVPHGLESELLGKLLDDKDPAVQARAAKALAYTRKGADHADRLIALLKGAGTPLRLAVISAMGGAEDKRFLGPLKGQLAHRDPSVRIATAWAVARWSPKDVHDPVAALLKDPVPEVRAATLQTLSFLRVATDALAVAKMLEDSSPLVRRRAIEALPAIDRQAAPRAIARLLRDPDYLVRTQAVEALGALRATELADEAAKLLDDDDDVVVRRYAVKAVGVLAGPKYLDRLRQLTKDKDDLIRQFAAEAVAAAEKSAGEPR